MGERSRELVHPDRIAVHEKVAAAGFAVLGEMHQRPGTVVHVYGRHPPPGLPKLEHTASCHDRLDDAFSKPRGVAVDPSRERGHDGESCHDVPIEAIEHRREATPPQRRTRRFVFGSIRETVFSRGCVSQTAPSAEVTTPP